MAPIWNRNLPEATRAETTPSARIDRYVAGKIERREGAIAQELGDLARAPDLSEVYTFELEEKQILCQSLAEQREAIECMRDYAAEMYRVLSGWPWSPARPMASRRT